MFKKKILIPEKSSFLFYNRTTTRGDFNWKLICLRIFLEKKGYEFHTNQKEKLSSYTYIFFTDSYDRSLLGKIRRIRYGYKAFPVLEAAIKENLDHKIVLFLIEPESVMPWNYKISNHKSISKIFTWREDLVDNKKYFLYLLASLQRHTKKNDFVFEKKKLIMNVTSNKYSSNKNELYSSRRKMIKFLDKNYEDSFDLFGPGWDDNGLLENFRRIIRYRQFDFYKYKTYRGLMGDKSDEIPKYKFILCYENSRYKNLITEKIFDVFFNNSVPIYYGALNISDLIPPNTYIDRSKFSSEYELMEYIKNINKKEYNLYIENIKTFLKSRDIKKFRSKEFVISFLKALKIS